MTRTRLFGPFKVATVLTKLLYKLSLSVNAPLYVERRVNGWERRAGEPDGEYKLGRQALSDKIITINSKKQQAALTSL